MCYNRFYEQTGAQDFKLISIKRAPYYLKVTIMSNIKSLKSIATKSLGYSAKEVRKFVDGKGDEPVFLARIGGIASTYFTGESKNGEFVGFKGAFLAQTRDGGMYESKTCYLPAQVSKDLRDRLSVGEVEIRVEVDVFAVESDKNASGYAYLCEPVMSEAADNRIKELAKTIFGKLPIAIEDKSKAKTKAA